MASSKSYSTHLELHEPEIEIPKPQPLRIIKRSQTISGSQASGEPLWGRCGASTSSEQSSGSPPSAADRPLTVHKKRQGRGSIFNGSLDQEINSTTGSPIADLIRRHKRDVNIPSFDLRVTPKASINTGNRTNSCSLNYSNAFEPDISDSGFLKSQDSMDPRSESSGMPERRFSRSKNLLMRAIGGKNAEISGSTRRNFSTRSKDTLIRRISQVRSNISASSGSYQETVGCMDSNCLLDPRDLDIAGMLPVSMQPSFEAPHPSFLVSDSISYKVFSNTFVLCPQIKFTPELSCVSIGSCSFWVAIEVTGVLRPAGDQEKPSLSSSRVFNDLPQSQDLSLYGRLHSMRIDLHPGQSCVVTELFGNLHEMKTIRANETQLILAKIRLDDALDSAYIRGASSAKMLADLQNQLGGTVLSYLTVRLTYKHSAFPSKKNLVPTSDGLSSHLTRIETEASAMIKRGNPQSAWSPCTSHTDDGIIESNLMMQLIEKRLPTDKVREILRKFADERSQVPCSHELGPNKGGTSKGLVKIIHKHYEGLSTTMTPSNLSLDHIKAIPPSSPEVLRSQQVRGSFAKLPTGTGAGYITEDMDPARKIWSEMRRTSRGNKPRRSRTSISADHYYALETIESDNISTGVSSRLLSLSTKVSDRAQLSGRKGLSESCIDQERSEIMDVALKNKRSLGADTLRSIAPSTGKSKGSTLLGLNVGKNWGWGQGWW